MKKVVLVGVTLILFSFCSSPVDISGDIDDDPPPSDETVHLTTSTEPSEGGTVNPSSGTFDEGSEVSISALPEDGWTFLEWTGDINSQDNPLEFTITSDTDLTAHFEQQVQAFTGEIQSSDSENSILLEFGMKANATSGFDTNMDQKAPPKPPPGSFYSHFVHNQTFLVKDFRPISEDMKSWKLEFEPETGNSISLSWSFTSGEVVGTIKLVDDLDNPTVEIDMLSENSYNVADPNLHVLYIDFN